MNRSIFETILETAFFYLLLAAFCSTATEWISILFNTRARMLAAAINELLDGQATAGGAEFANSFYAHPIVTAMMDRRRHPSHLPARAFVTAVIDIATSRFPGPLTFAALTDSIESLPPGDVRTALKALIKNTDGDLTRAEANIESWFNDAMSRVTRSYKQRAALRTALTAAVLTVTLDANTIAMLGASDAPHTQVTRVTGWLLTIAAVSLGAPFWFGVLKRPAISRER